MRAEPDPVDSLTEAEYGALVDGWTDPERPCSLGIRKAFARRSLPRPLDRAA